MLKPRWNKGIAAEDAGNSDGPGGRGRKVPARLLTSQLCNAGERIAKLCEQLHFWQDQSQDLQHDLRLKLAQKAAVDARHERRGALARRLQKLQGDLRQRREGLRRLKDFPAATSGRLELHALQACASLRDRQKLLDPEQLLRAQEMLQELQGQRRPQKQNFWRQLALCRRAGSVCGANKSESCTKFDKFTRCSSAIPTGRFVAFAFVAPRAFATKIQERNERRVQPWDI